MKYDHKMVDTNVQYAYLSACGGLLQPSKIPVFLLDIRTRVQFIKEINDCIVTGINNNIKSGGIYLSY